MATGSFIAVGTGIKLVAHVTLESQAVIQQSDKLFYLVNNSTMAHWLHQQNKTAESLHPFYTKGKLRLQSYQEMSTHLLKHVQQGIQVCAAFYGHPGVFATVAHKTITAAKQAGYPAHMLPGISAEACLFADLGLDPGHRGCQSYEVTDFLLRDHPLNVHVPLILWQMGVIGQLHQPQIREIKTGLALLTDVLTTYYGRLHTVTLYQAATLPTLPPQRQQIPIEQLPHTPITPMATLYVPAKTAASIKPERLAHLNIQATDLKW